MSARVKSWFTAVPAAAVCAAVSGWYLHRLGCTPLEAGRLLLGLVLLWGPLGALLYALLPAAIEDRLSRLALAWSASYALTTLGYFGCAVLGLPAAFYVLQAVALLAALVLFRRAGRTPTLLASEPRPGFDWGLLLLIGLVLGLNVRSQEAFQTTEENGQTRYTYLQYGDQLYHVGQAYELSRHIPPHQSTVRGGSPAPAYHNFPHVTMMLIARYTGQPDFLRAHLFYHYTVLEILFCLCLFSIARTLTGARWPGYLAILLMYALIFDSPQIKKNGLPCYYFTWFPHASSGLEPLLGTSPQMYSGLAVLFGLFLGLVWWCKARADGRPLGWLACVLTLMTVSTLRFRIHIFLVLFPLCLLALALWWKRSRSWLPPTLAAVALLGSGLLYWEMKGPQYLPETANVRIRYNGLSDPKVWLAEWPMAETAKACVQDFTDDPDYRRWLWQVVSITSFTLFNVIGLPLLVGTALALCSSRMRRQYRWFLYALVAMTGLSIAGGVLLSTDYDNYSVGGQMLFHTHWYLFALHPIPIWLIYRYLRDRRRWPAWALGGTAVVVVAALLVLRVTHPPKAWWAHRFILSSDERLVLYYLHETAPADAVILTNRYVDVPFFPTSGLSGRAVYLEWANDTANCWAERLNPRENRLQRLQALWTQHDPTRFRELLRQTHATILLEYADTPLVVEGGRPGLTRIWQSPHREVFVYLIDP